MLNVREMQKLFKNISLLFIEDDIIIAESTSNMLSQLLSCYGMTRMYYPVLAAGVV